MATVIELIDQAIEKYGSIMKAPENCDEFVEIRRISPEEIKPGTAEYEERKKKRLFKRAERDRKILDLIDDGYPAEMVADKMGLNVSTIRESARTYGIRDFGRYFRWHAERNGVQYYSTRRIDLENRKFKRDEIQRVELLKFEIPNGAHYCEFKQWHIKKRKD